MPEAVDLRLNPEQAELLRNLLATHVPGAEVWAYGSRVNGGAHEGSDLDLLLRHPDGASVPVTGADALRDALQASALPMLVEVHDSAYLPQTFLDEVGRAHLVVQAASGKAGAAPSQAAPTPPH